MFISVYSSSASSPSCSRIKPRNYCRTVLDCGAATGDNPRPFERTMLPIKGPVHEDWQLVQTTPKPASRGFTSLPEVSRPAMIAERLW